MSGPNTEIMAVVSTFFESGKRRDFVTMKGVLADGPDFTCFGDTPPFGMHDAQTTVILEEMRLAAISDYDYDIQDERILVAGDAAVATFGLHQKGMLVDNKTFSGKIMSAQSRATFVLVKKGEWKIAHIHISRADQ